MSQEVVELCNGELLRGFEQRRNTWFGFPLNKHSCFCIYSKYVIIGGGRYNEENNIKISKFQQRWDTVI